MNRIKVVLILLTVFGLTYISLFIKPREIKAYVCSADRYCVDLGTLDEGVLFGCAPYGGSLGDIYCICSRFTYDCSGTDTNCSGEIDLYSTMALCEAGGATNLHAGCCNKITCVECTPGAAPSCPTGTVGPSSGSTDEHSKVSTCCDNPDGCTDDQECNTRQCYCAICTPPTCESVSLSSTPLGYGSTTNKACCLNGVSNTPDRATKCDNTCRTCYCDRCELNACPAPLSNTTTTTPPEGNLILDDFRTCTNECARTRTGDCYEPFSPQPTEELEIKAVENAYDFISYSHTGVPGTSAGNLNDPVNMVATYSDVNGANDIEGLFVWFGNPNTWEVDSVTGGLKSPIWIATTGTTQSFTKDNWGFMMHKENGIWMPYVPSYLSDPVTWKRINAYNPDIGTFYIKGIDAVPENMIKVILPASGIYTSGLNDIVMDFKLKFSGTDILQNVSQNRHKIMLMGLDKFSFTPFDNYSFSVSNFWADNKLRYKASVIPEQTYARDWTDTLKTWTVDRVSPTIQFTGGTPSASGNTIQVSWSAQDTKSLYSIVGNIYSTAGAEAREISFPLSTGGVTFNTPFTPGAEVSSNTGRLQGNWAFKVVPNMNLITHTGSVSIDVGGNRTGSLVFYLTVFDDAGNMATTSQTYDLNDWFVTDGGLAYSEGGTTFQTRRFNPITTPPDIWSNILPPFTITGESLIYNYADYSSEMWGEKTTIGAPSALEKYIPNQEPKSYNIKRFKGHGLGSYYDTLLEAYEKKKGGISSLIEKNLSGDKIIEGNLNGNNDCGGNVIKYCVLRIKGNLQINPAKTTFICNRNTLIFVDGNLTIQPDILNHQNQQRNAIGCIFVASGNVIIGEGFDNSNSSSLDYRDFRYDRVNAYILADGDITMEEENKTGTRIRDGLYINGGIQSLGAQGIVIDRYLRLIDRFTFPILAIDGHPKYGVLGGVFFGNDFMMQKTEVGLKPY